MTWIQLRRPFIGLHWWYRKITGVWYTYPVMNMLLGRIYWKENRITGKLVECKILNYLSDIKFYFIRKRVEDSKNQWSVIRSR